MGWIIVYHNPLFLLPPRGFGCRNCAVEAVDRPAEFLREAFDGRVREHGEHKPAFDLGKDREQSFEVCLVECSIVVSAVAADIRWIDEVECTLAVITGDHAQSILTFDGDAAEPFAQFLSESFFTIAELLGGGTTAVVAERTVDHRCEA